MKALLLVEDDQRALGVGTHVEGLGFDLVRYRNPLKALDNLDEISPHVVIASALDFPRHWKIIADVIRTLQSRQDCVIILLRGERFSADEAAKASFLGVNAILDERLSPGPDLAKFRRLLRRFARLIGEREGGAGPSTSWDGLKFLFTHPGTARVIGGRIVTLSAGGLSLEVADPALIASLNQGEVVEGCTLRIGTRILVLRGTIARPGNPIGIAFPQISTDDRALIGLHLSGERH